MNEVTSRPAPRKKPAGSVEKKPKARKRGPRLTLKKGQKKNGKTEKPDLKGINENTYDEDESDDGTLDKDIVNPDSEDVDMSDGKEAEAEQVVDKKSPDGKEAEAEQVIDKKSPEFKAKRLILSAPRRPSTPKTRF